jgi:hypothetical protein
MCNYQKQCNTAVDGIWKINKSLSDHQQLASTMLNLIYQRRSNIITRIEPININEIVYCSFFLKLYFSKL